MKSGEQLYLSSGVQRPGAGCFVGGIPALPQGMRIPTCRNCGEEQSFLLQIRFPEDHEWRGWSIALFACTSCAEWGKLIPQLLPGNLKGAQVPSEFLDSYQTNFRFLVFPTDAADTGVVYEERVAFGEIVGSARRGSTTPIGKIGGTPEWILDDETPASVDTSDAACFLFQLAPNLEFSLVDGAPREMKLDIFGGTKPSTDAFYRLFIGNAVYFFGSSSQPSSRVYALPQSD